MTGTVSTNRGMDISLKLRNTELQPIEAITPIDEGKEEMNELKDENEKLKEQLRAMQNKLKAMEVVHTDTEYETRSNNINEMS